MAKRSTKDRALVIALSLRVALAVVVGGGFSAEDIFSQFDILVALRRRCQQQRQRRGSDLAGVGWN